MVKTTASIERYPMIGSVDNGLVGCKGDVGISQPRWWQCCCTDGSMIGWLPAQQKYVGGGQGVGGWQITRQEGAVDDVGQAVGGQHGKRGAVGPFAQARDTA